MHIARTTPITRTAVTVLLMTALLFAQWAGLAHRVDHGPLASLHADAADTEDGLHSCVAFDAAAVADAISVPPIVTPPVAGTRVLALWTAFASWDAPPNLPFSSRAPPVS
jgi:hypothetical protein